MKNCKMEMKKFKRECSRCEKEFVRIGKFGLLCDECLFKARRLKVNHKLKEIMEIIDEYEKMPCRDIDKDLREKIYKVYEK